MPRVKRGKKACVSMPKKYSWLKVTVTENIITDEVDASVQTIPPNTRDRFSQTEQYTVTDHTYADIIENEDRIENHSEDDVDNYSDEYFVNVASAHSGSKINSDNVHVDISENVVEVETVTFKEFSDAINAELGSIFIVRQSQEDVKILQLYEHSAPSVKLCVQIKDNFLCNIFVHNKLLPKSHRVWKGLPQRFDSVTLVKELCTRILSMVVCIGNPDEMFMDLLPIGSELSTNNPPEVVAYREGDFNAKTGKVEYNSSIRSVQCDLLVPIKRQRCFACSYYRSALRKRNKRIELKKHSTRKFIHTSYKHQDMTREELVQKIGEQREHIDDLQRTMSKLKRDFDTTIRKNGIQIKGHGF